MLHMILRRPPKKNKYEEVCDYDIDDLGVEMSRGKTFKNNDAVDHDEGFGSGKACPNEVHPKAISVEAKGAS